MKSFKEIKLLIIIPLALVLTNFVIKFFFISSNSIGGDEPFSIYHAQMDIISIIKLLSSGNNPPLYEILLHFWIKIFGISALAVRLPSLIFSCITVFYIYRFGIRYLNAKVAVYSSLIFIFSNYQVLFAHEARAYALLGMLSIMSMYYFMELVLFKNSLSNQPINKQSYVLFILSSILLIYSHYFGFFILIVQVLFILSNKNLLTTYWKQLLLIFGILVVLYLPNLFVLFNRFHDSSANGTWVIAPNGVKSIYNMLRLFSNAPVVAVSAILIFLSAIIKYLVNRKSEANKLSAKLVVLWFTFIFFFMFGISYLIPMFLDRYLMPAFIAFCILLAIASEYLLRRKWFEYIIPGVLCILFITTIKPNITNKRNVKETVAKINEIKDKNTLVIICPYNFLLNYAYYQNIDIFKDYNISDIYKNIDKDLRSENIYGIRTINEIDYKKWNHIVYLDAAADFSCPNNNIKNSLDKSYKIKNEYTFYEIFKVYEYKSE